jgi:hypothetical protein
VGLKLMFLIATRAVSLLGAKLMRRHQREVAELVAGKLGGLRVVGGGLRFGGGAGERPGLEQGAGSDRPQHRGSAVGHEVVPRQPEPGDSERVSMSDPLVAA